MEPITNENIRNLVNRYLYENDGLPPINSWDVSAVTNMSKLFFLHNFNEPLDGWNVSNVTNMSEMFASVSFFNQPLHP
jgi:surface protein